MWDTSNVPRHLILNVSWAALAVVSLCLVAACGPNADRNKAAGGPATSAAAPTSGPDQVINVSDLPHLKGGLWQMALNNGAGRPATSTSCLSGKTSAMKMPKECAQFTIKRTFLGAIVMDMSCATPDYTMVMHMEGTGDFQRSMASDTTMTMTMKGQPAPRVTKTHVDAHYIGPCSPGQKPDDAPDTSSSAPG